MKGSYSERIPVNEKKPRLELAKPIVQLMRKLKRQRCCLLHTPESRHHKKFVNKFCTSFKVTLESKWMYEAFKG